MKKQIFALGICLFSLFLYLTNPVYAAPVINELSSSGSEDWIEIYNPGSESLDLTIYRFRDSSETNKLDLSGILGPLGFAVFDWSNKLNNGGDLLKLILINDSSIVDQVSYGDQGGFAAPDVNQSLGRSLDGGTSWVIFTNQSKNSSNNSSSVFVPPTLTPTKTPTPTRSPTPTKSPTPEKIITQASTKTPTSVKTSQSVTSIISRIPTQSIFSKPNNSAKIAGNLKIASKAGIKNLTITPAKDFGKTEVLGVRDQRMSFLALFGGILFFLTGAGIFILKYVDIGEIYEKVFNK